MNVSLADKLKKLRKSKNISQEKLAEYLGVSYQAVSKWENDITSPDIQLLPSIARYYGITVDELLQVEQIDADVYFNECSLKAETLFRDGKIADLITLWNEAHKKLPNDIRIKEMLMSAYFDTDKIKYQNEIIELGIEIYNTNTVDGGSSYYQGQAITQIARTYHENGNTQKANEWARKAHQINHCQELLFMQIHDEENWLTDTFAFTNYWYLEILFYMAMRLYSCNVKCFGADYVQKVNETVVNIFEVVYSNSDMSYESLQKLCILHRCIAEAETNLGNNETTVQKHLTQAVECAVKSVSVKSHALTQPLMYGWAVADAPTDNMQIVRTLKEELRWQCFDKYRNNNWFSDLVEQLNEIL